MERVPPILNDRTTEYWRSGADGVLSIARCQECGWYLHPPLPVCPKCRECRVRFEPVSGRGTVYSFTINRYRWTPGMEPPYVVAQVELVEQEGLYILTNIVDCDPEAVRIDMEVTVTFEHAGESWVPVFKA